MSLVEVVGWSATLVGALLGLPQLLRLVRTRNVEGLSLFAWRCILCINLVWLAHGIRISAPPQIVTNLVALGITLPLVILLARSANQSLPRVLTPSLVAAAAVIAIDYSLGSLAFGIAAMVPGIFANGGQSLEIVRAPLVDGLAPMFLVLACVNQCLWVSWALLVHDPGSILAASLTLAMTTFNLAWFGLRQLGLRPFFVHREPVDEPVPVPC